MQLNISNSFTCKVVALAMCLYVVCSSYAQVVHKPVGITAKANGKQLSKTACLSDKCIRQLFLHDSNFTKFHPVESIAVRRTSDEGIWVYYFSMKQWDSAYNNTFYDSIGADEQRKEYYVEFYADIKGTLLIDKRGKIISSKTDTVYRYYSLGCGLQEEQHTKDQQFKTEDEAPTPGSNKWYPYPDHGYVIESVKFSCDTVWLCDKPYGKRLKAFTNKKEVLKCDRIADIDFTGTEITPGETRFAHVVDKQRSEGYWVMVDNGQNTGEAGYVAEHYTISLINKKNKYKRIYEPHDEVRIIPFNTSMVKQ